MKYENNNISEENENESNDGFILFIKAIVGICFIPLVIGYFGIPRFASSSKVWRIKEFTLKLVFLSILLLPVQVILFKFSFHFLFHKNWALGILLIFLSWITLTPLSLLIGSYRLTEIQTQFVD
jgi:hypothetical protein